jgi:hypothetical protein
MRKVRFRFKRNPGVFGLAFQDEWRIELDPDLDDKTLIDIAIHETTHVVAPDLSEECVDRIGRQCADVLWRLGFRKDEER